MATLLLLSLLPLPQTTATTPTRTPTYTPCPQVPTLRCRNGSTCISGLARYSPSDLSALSYLQTHEDGYHCDCLPGFIGHECQIEVHQCESGGGEYDPTSVEVARCYHGAKCKRRYDDDMNFDAMSHYCDCEEINKRTSSTGSKYAGLMCEHEATSLCAVGLAENYAPDGQFCTNHGKCVRLVTGSDPHPGCVCRDGYAGERCELKAVEGGSVPKATSGVEGGGSPTGRWVLFSVLLATMASVAFAVIVMLCRIRIERSGPKPVGNSAGEAGVGNLEPDGSGTLGLGAGDVEGGTAVGRTEEDGDLEMKESVVSETTSNDDTAKEEDRSGEFT